MMDDLAALLKAPKFAARKNSLIATAAEAIAAAQFARCGFDVSVQYGANQPEYDLIVADGGRMLKVSVKGNSDGGWMLSVGHKKGKSYAEAADAWRAMHKDHTAVCLVQFRGIAISDLPLVYLATPDEIAIRLKATAGGLGSTVLYHNREWKRAPRAKTIDKVPDDWTMTQSRISQLIGQIGSVPRAR